VKAIDRAVFVAGGVGVNPIMSMLSALDGVGPAVTGRVGGMPRVVRVLYSCRRGEEEGGRREEVLFEERLAWLARKWEGSKEVDYRYTFFETSGGGREAEETSVRSRARRIRHEDLFEALGPEGERKGTVVYVCGVPGMTDEFVDVLKKQSGMSERQVCCEKWW
jgi:NAD(P)H-flavin reductase